MPAVNAATVSLDTPTFSIEYDDAQAGLDRWGLPRAVAGSISFLPVNFAAIATGTAAAADTANATVQFTLTAKNGFRFSNFDWFERGDYIRLLFPEPETGIFVDGEIQVFNETTGQAVVEGLAVSDLSAPGFNIDWQATADLNETDFSDPLTRVTITLENDLLAYVQDGQFQAKIEKKFGQLKVTTVETVVPIPPAAFMFLSAILALVGVARRRA